LQRILEQVRMTLFTSEMSKNLMYDLLDLEQVALNTFKLNKEFFSLFDAIEQAFCVVSHIAAQKRIRLVMPSCPEEQHENYENIYGDKNRLVQVILNFLSNSLKYSKCDTKIKLVLVLREV
jgi:signal transduction histidine kinase